MDHSKPTPASQSEGPLAPARSVRSARRILPAWLGSPRRVVIATLASLALLFALKLGVGWVLDGRFMVETDDAYVEADTTVIAPQVAGTVAEVLVAENAHVRAGDVLVRLADAEYRARVAQAESAVATQQAVLANIDARLRWQQSMIRTAEATMASARSDVERMSSDLQRYARLATGQFASAQRYEAAKNDAEKARAADAKASAAHDAERDQLEILSTQRTQTFAQIRQAEAQLELARIDLERTIIRAPVEGVAGNRGVQVGQYVRPGTQLLSIVPIPLIRVVANFKETQIAGLRRGQDVVIRADAWPDTVIRGKVESFSPASGSRFSLLPPENATGNFTKIVQRVPVRITMDPANALQGRLRPGLSVTVRIDRRHPGDGGEADLLVPTSRPASAPLTAGRENGAAGAGRTTDLR